ncbi:MAG: hypothetical protein ACRDPM_22595 [Solirubrobacteraceae bacterium]
MTRATRRAGARVGLVSATLAVVVAIAGCAQSSNTTSTGGAGAAPPTSSTPTSSTPTGPTGTTTTTSGSVTGSGPLTVSPASGSPQSVIHFAFVAPATAGVRGHDEVSAGLTVMGPQKAGCVGVHRQALASLPAGQQTSVSLGPAQLGGDWCPGTYTARVLVVARPRCGPGMMCPQFIRVVATLGPATFRISG